MQAVRKRIFTILSLCSNFLFLSLFNVVFISLKCKFLWFQKKKKKEKERKKRKKKRKKEKKKKLQWFELCNLTRISNVNEKLKFT